MVKHTSRHVKVKPKDLSLKRKIKEPKETIKAFDDLVDAEGFVCLPSSQDLPEELESEIQAFRRNRVTFATQIKEKLKETSALDPKIVEVYGNIGKIFKNFRSGKIPKAFKIIPGLEN